VRTGWQAQPWPRGVSAGYKAEPVTLGRRQLPVMQPQRRTAAGSGELPLPSYDLFASTGMLGRMALEKILAGLSSATMRGGVRPSNRLVREHLRAVTNVKGYGSSGGTMRAGHRRWNEGCRDAAVLHAEITQLGCRGSLRTLYRYLQPLRAGTTSAPLTMPPKISEGTSWLLRRDEHLSPRQQLLADLRSHCAQLDRLAGHVTSFANSPMMTKQG
jgi:hypothetical protein